MDPRYRDAYNPAFSRELYERYVARLCGAVGGEVPFRVAETPVFLPPDLRKRCERSAREIVALLCEPRRLELLKRAIPSEWNVPRMDELPSFVQVDFGVARDSRGALVPRLIELQGFPSLTAFQVLQRDAWSETLREIPGLERDWRCWFSGLDRDQFLDLARKTIVGDHDPEEVILMDLDPPSQKTYPDFAATRRLFGVEPVCPTRLVRRGKELFRPSACGPGLIPVRRIYNRVVFDELFRKQVPIPFDYREDLDVEWTPHPNWFWAWSKFSVPLLDHPAVPRAVLLSELDKLPEDLGRRFVLKPLFSFAGGGVNIAPKRKDIKRIPETDRSGWCLQEKIDYEPALHAADGGRVKVEIRMMFLKPAEEPVPILAQNLCRLSRGAMMGVDFNRDFTWVGSSVALWAE